MIRTSKFKFLFRELMLATLEWKKCCSLPYKHTPSGWMYFKEEVNILNSLDDFLDVIKERSLKVMLVLFQPFWLLLFSFICKTKKDKLRLCHKITQFPLMYHSYKKLYNLKNVVSYSFSFRCQKLIKTWQDSAFLIITSI